MTKHKPLFLILVALAVFTAIVVQTHRANEQHKAAQQALAQACAKPVEGHFRKPAHCFNLNDDSGVLGPRI